jgi:hypothetical protein
MDSEIAAAVVATILTGGVGALSSVFGLGTDIFAQYTLSRLMTRNDHARQLQTLRHNRVGLAKNPPDAEALQASREVVRGLAAELPGWQKRAVLKSLQERSDADSAEYILRLVDAAVRRLGPGDAETLSA